MKMDAKSEPEQASKRAAQLGSALCLEKEGKQKEAISILNEIIKTTSSQQSPLLAEAYLRMGDCYRELGEPKEALIAYLHIDVLFPTEPAVHAEALYHLSTLWGKVQKPERASKPARSCNSNILIANGRKKPQEADIMKRMSDSGKIR